MAEDKKDRVTLTDDDIVTSPKISRRSLLAGAGIALGTVALAGRSVKAAEADSVDSTDDKDGVDKDTDKDPDKDPDSDPNDKDADADGDKGDDKDKGDESERDSD